MSIETRSTDKKTPIFIARVRLMYRFVIHGAIVLLALAFGYSFYLSAGTSLIQAEQWLVNRLYDPFSWIVLVVIANTIVYVETRRVVFWTNHFCDWKYFLFRKCYAYNEIQSIGEDHWDDNLMINLKDGKTVLFPKFILDDARELELLGMEIREFLDLRRSK